MAGEPSTEDQVSTIAPSSRGRLSSLDRWMALHPWHPRITPFLVYVLAILLLSWSTERWPASYLIISLLRAAVVLALLWRYRRLMPELTLSFDWLAVPVGVFVFLAWVWLGIATEHFQQVWRGGLLPYTQQLWAWMVDPHGKAIYYEDVNARSMFDQYGQTLGAVSFGLRLAIMAALVPIFEELFIRSLMLRSLSSFRRTGLGVLQFFQDLPLLGEWFSETHLGTRVARHPPVFGPQFDKTPLGRLTLFGVTASTIVFMLSHRTRDWPGTVVCGVAYCLLLAATRKKGLGPVIWAHGVTNALLWAYTLHTGDWRFL